MESHNLEFDTPKHPIEHKIMLLLGVQGYKHKDLRFKDCSDGRILNMDIGTVLNGMI